MNNRIKFRIWDKVEKEWLDPDSFALSGNGNGLLFKDYNEWIQFNSEDFEIQQFTGEYDSKNIPIYEGDIMASRGNYITDELDKNGKFPDLFCVVVWNKNHTRFGLKAIEDYKDYDPNGEFSHVWTCYLSTFKEVIGNIYENPKLLK